MSRVMKDSEIPWIGAIPQDWEVRKFKQLFQIKKDIAGTLGYNVLSVTQKGIKVKDITRNEGQLAQDYSKYQLVYPNDFVMNHMDLLTGYVDCAKQEGVTSPDYRTFRAIDSEEIENNYYLKIFQFCYSDAIFYKLGQGVSNFGRWRLPAEQQNGFPLPFFSIAEQKVIAEYLDVKCAEVDELIALQEKMIDELKVYKQSVITEAVTKGLNSDAPLKDSGIEWIGKIPEHWVVTPLKYLCKIRTGNQDTQDNVAEGKFPFYVRSPKVERSNKYTFEGESILMAGDGAGAGKIFHLADGRFGCHQRVYCMQGFNKVYRKILYYLLQSTFYLSIETANTKSTVDSVRLPMLLEFSAFVYPISEQQQIADYLDTKCAEIDEMTSIKQQKIEQLKEYKKSIIYEYVTGKKQVNF